MKYKGDGIFVLSTGTEIDAMFGAIGLSPEYLEREQYFTLTHGSDGYLPPLTKEETAEVADYMVELWIEVKKRGLISK